MHIISLEAVWGLLTCSVSFFLDEDPFSNYQALLPSANEVWGKVMFSQVFVYPAGRGFVFCHFLSSCLVPCSFWGVSVWRVLSRRVSVQTGSLSGGVSVQGDLCQGDPSGTEILPLG